VDGTSPLTRRRALGLALGAGATAALAGSGTIAGSPPAGGEAGRAPGLLAVPARVTAVSGTNVAAEALDPVLEPAEPWTAVPLSGFPWGLVPRVGDHVTVTDSVVGMAMAAIPLCSWLIGIPTSSQGAYLVAGRLTVPVASVVGEPGPALSNAVATAREVAVALVDTDLGASLVLQVRNPTTPPAESNGA